MAVVGSMVAEQELSLSSFLHDDEDATVNHQIDVRPQDIDDLDGTLHDDILGNIDEESVLCQHGVQVAHGIVVLAGEEVVAHPLPLPKGVELMCIVFQ